MATENTPLSPTDAQNTLRSCQKLLNQENIIQKFASLNLPVATKFPCLNNRPLFFVHIPKTAGASVQQFLDSQFDDDDIYPGWNSSDLISNESTQNYLLFRGHFTAGQITFAPKETELFTILRKPEEQIYSFYEWVKHLDQSYWATAEDAAIQSGVSMSISPVDRKNPERYMLAAKTQDFTEFVLRDDPLSRTFTDNVQMSHISDIGGTNSYLNAKYSDMQSFGNRYARQALAVSARENLSNCLVTGIFEKLNITLLVLCWKRHWPAPDALSNIHSNIDKNTSEHICFEANPILREKISIDSELYSIANTLLETNWQQLVKIAGGTSYVKNFLDLQHRKHFFLHTPRLIAIDISAKNAWPGIGWGLKGSNEHGQVWRWMGSSGKASLFLPLITSIQYILIAAIHSAINTKELVYLNAAIGSYNLPLIGNDIYEGYPSFKWLITQDIIEKNSGQIELEFTSTDSHEERVAIAFSRIICHPYQQMPS